MGIIFNENALAKGVYTFEAFDVKQNKLWEKKYENIVTQNFFTSLFKTMNGENANITLSQLATGDGTTAVAKTDTALTNELFRKNATSRSYTTTAITMKTKLFLYESNFTIKEVGIFGADGGMISHCLVDAEKNVSIELLVTYVLTIV